MMGFRPSKNLPLAVEADRGRQTYNNLLSTSTRSTPDLCHQRAMWMLSWRTACHYMNSCMELGKAVQRRQQRKLEKKVMCICIHMIVLLDYRLALYSVEQ
jgi:hypothetical protein